jgi:hypothetical protein
MAAGLPWAVTPTPGDLRDQAPGFAASALTAAELRVLPMLATHLSLPGDRRRDVPVTAPFTRDSAPEQIDARLKGQHQPGKMTQ